MPSTYSPNLRIELIASGEQANTWGNTTNTNLGTLIEQAIAGLSSIDVTAGNVTLTAYNGASDQSRQMILNVTGTPGVARTLTAPSVSKVYVIANNSNADVTIETATGTGVTVSSGYSKFVFCDGTDFSDVTTETTVLAVEDLIVNGDATLGDALTDVITINGTVQPGVVISGSSSSAALRITQTGTGNALVVEDSANPDSTPFVIDADGRVGVGGTPGVGQRFLLAGSLSGATTAYGQWNYLTPQSDVTSAAIGYATNLQTAAASFSLSELSHYKSIQGTLGAGSTVTNQYGFNVTSSLTGATNNYGFYSNIASGSGRFNFYAAGTADNYFAGSVGIGGTSVGGAYGNVSNQIALTGATAVASYGAIVTINSDVTSSATVYKSQPTTQASAFTLSALYHFSAQQYGFGAGSTVTSQIGYLADVSLTSATNNYGFYSNIASGSGRYNFYAAGTADNYFAGSVGIGALATTASQKLFVAGGGLTASSFQTIDNQTYIPSTGTGSILNYRSVIGTNAASFVVGTAVHFTTSQAALGAGSSITNQIGFEVQSSLTGATNNYGFYSNIASGSGRYNFYAAGTAVNYFAGRIGIGNIDTSVIQLRLSGNISGSTDAYGMYADGVVQSGVTSRASVFFTIPSTAAASFNLASLAHFQAVQGTFGAGSAVTSQFGFLADSSLTGATNNYGFYSNIASGSGRFNFYAAGNASNYFAGNVGIGIFPDASISLDISGAGNRTMRVWDFDTTGSTVATLQAAWGAGGGTTRVNLVAGNGYTGLYSTGASDPLIFATGNIERMRIDSAGRVGIGGTSAGGAYGNVSNQIALTGATAVASYGAIVTINSDVTSSATVYKSQPTTQASAFTLSALYHFSAQQYGFGAGSTVTSQIGYLADVSLTSATNNYGFYSNIASGSGRYNFYAAGTADNYFAGLVLSNSSIKSNSATAGIGYGTGAGGTVTQTISRTTGVTLNKICGSVTVFSAAATVAANFTVTNSTVSATDTILCSVQASGATEPYLAIAHAVANGSFKIYMSSPGTTTEAPTINFTVIKSVTA